ncbi:hypothetical protein AYO38_08780 [bacterium SCGC AG-212-C10]|nr:hypothetical protein AYO38_08780 [bacterium SCGC AG-212-C10]
MNTATDIGTLISSSPAHYGGWPCIASCGFPVANLAVIMNEEHLTAEEIQSDLPHLTLAEVYAGIAYYLLNKDEIDADLALDAALFREEAAAAKASRAAL